MGADVTCPDLGLYLSLVVRNLHTSQSVEGRALLARIGFALASAFSAICARFEEMFQPAWETSWDSHSWDSRRILFGAKGELIAESRATARRREENVFGVLDFMGGLAGGRVRSRNSRGIPKKKSCSLNSLVSVLE
mgnify:CR=1 FL=1